MFHLAVYYCMCNKFILLCFDSYFIKEYATSIGLDQRLHNCE
jgi:hypothetical protein